MKNRLTSTGRFENISGKLSGFHKTGFCNLKEIPFKAILHFKLKKAWLIVLCLSFAGLMPFYANNSFCQTLPFVMEAPVLYMLLPADATVNINGHVTGTPNNNNIENAKVVVVRPDNGMRIDSMYTDMNGFYNKDFKVSLTGNPELGTENTTVYPNPYSDKTNLQTYINKPGNYNLNVFSADGKLLLNTSVELLKGENTITFNGGKPGLELITLSSADFKKTYKALKITGDDSPINFEVTQTQNSTYQNTGNFKSTLDDIIILEGQAIQLEFSKNGYTTATTNLVVAQTNTVNKELQQELYTFTTTLKPFLETGEPITNLKPNFTIKIQWSDGTEQTYPVNNGQINISKDIYKNADGTLGTAWISNDTTGIDGVLNWSLIRQINQKTNRPNVVQNQTTPDLATSYVTPNFKTQVPLDSLDNKTLNYYTIRKRAETQPGVFEPLNSGFSVGLYGSSGGLGNSMFIDLKPVGAADSLDFVRFGYNIQSGTPNTPEQQARLDNLFQIAINQNYLPNGDTLFPPHRIYTILSTADPKWQEVVARGYDNLVYTAFRDGTPQNERFWLSTFSYNGHLRNNMSAASYNIFESDGIIFTENFSAVNFEEEGSGSMSQFVWNATTNQPSEYSYSIATIPKLLNLGIGMYSKK